MNKNSIVIRQIAVGPMQNFSYIAGDKESLEIAVIDPGWDADKIIQVIKKENFIPKMVLLTHGHYDHVDAAIEIAEKYDIYIYISAEELDIMKPGFENLIEVLDGQEITLGNYKFNCIHTPGHSPGSQCFLFDKFLFTGDTVFLDGCGRWDLPGGNKNELFGSIKNKIAVLDDNIVVYPGHDYHQQKFDTIGHLKNTNPCFK